MARLIWCSCAVDVRDAVFAVIGGLQVAVRGRDGDRDGDRDEACAQHRHGRVELAQQVTTGRPVKERKMA